MEKKDSVSVESIKTNIRAVPEPEVPEKAVRRKFTAAYKLRIFKEAETCIAPGQIGAPLRREGIYSSHLAKWRRQAEEGLIPKKRGPQKPDANVRHIAELEKENIKLASKLKQAELIIEVQKSSRSHERKQRGEIMNTVVSLGKEVGIRKACHTLDIPRANFYRWKSTIKKQKVRPLPHLALSPSERTTVLDILHEDRFINKSPHEIYATLLDEKRYICSIRTMYRILEKEGVIKERRNQLIRPHYARPELIAEAPNQVWSWDITKLKRPLKWTYYYLYVNIDIFSRYGAGWMASHSELAALAGKLTTETIEKQSIKPGQLTIHADRGSSMTSKSVAFLLSVLGVTKRHSRPSDSNDNPYSESQFKTMKYRPEFPDRFGSIEDTRVFCQTFFSWYNNEHYHSGLGLLTPYDVHYGRAADRIKTREEVLLSAYEKHPERFKRKIPKPMAVPQQVWINKPVVKHEEVLH